MRDLTARIAGGLLRQRDARQRRLLILRYSIVLLLLFLAHSYFSNLSSPLKLIPQTFSAIAMGYVLLCIVSLRQFKYVAEFINWDKVTAAAEERRGFEVIPPTVPPGRAGAGVTPEDQG